MFPSRTLVLLLTTSVLRNKTGPTIPSPRVITIMRRHCNTLSTSFDLFEIPRGHIVIEKHVNDVSGSGFVLLLLQQKQIKCKMSNIRQVIALLQVKEQAAHK
jgi:hypothetical protein